MPVDFYAECFGCPFQTNSPKQAELHMDETDHLVWTNWGEEEDA
jgi:hypothetical protein